MTASRLGVVEAGAPPAVGSRRGDVAAGPELAEQLAGAGAVAVEQLEQQTLEVGRHLDVHARAESVGTTGSIVSAPVSSQRVRMSLVFEATTKPATSRPICWATQPASTLPKLPVGTLNTGAASPPSSARAAVT